MRSRHVKVPASDSRTSSVQSKHPQGGATLGEFVGFRVTVGIIVGPDDGAREGVSEGCNEGVPAVSHVSGSQPTPQMGKAIETDRQASSSGIPSSWRSKMRVPHDILPVSWSKTSAVQSAHPHVKGMGAGVGGRGLMVGLGVSRHVVGLQGPQTSGKSVATEVQASSMAPPVKRMRIPHDIPSASVSKTSGVQLGQPQSKVGPGDTVGELVKATGAAVVGAMVAAPTGEAVVGDDVMPTGAVLTEGDNVALGELAEGAPVGAKVATGGDGATLAMGESVGAGVATGANVLLFVGANVLLTLQRSG